MNSPLSDLRVIEFAAQGPGPFAGSLLADFGADVVLIDRPAHHRAAAETERRWDFYHRNKRSIALDLKSPEGVDQAKALISRADILIEGYRPGVMERLGLGPEVCLALNPRLIFGRMTGWGQEGPMAQVAGHDINYLALSGALSTMGIPGMPPSPPLNLVADLGGGAMFLAFGLMIGLHHARASGKGQVVDVAMLDGISQLMSAFHGFRQQGSWSDKRQDNIADGGAPWFATYATSDGKYVSVGALEDQFWAELLDALGLDPATLPNRAERENWPELRAILAARFARQTRDQWDQVMEGRQACYAPVLSMAEATQHLQMRARHSFSDMDGRLWPSPAPRLSLTPGQHRNPPPLHGAQGPEIRRDWGLD